MGKSETIPAAAKYFNLTKANTGTFTKTKANGRQDKYKDHNSIQNKSHQENYDGTPKLVRDKCGYKSDQYKGYEKFSGGRKDCI